MNQLLDVQAELDHLERCLEDYLSPQLLETSRTVLDTLRIRPDQKPRWTERLSPFVVLYPLLQSQAWSERPTDTARTANVVHLFLLMHTFIDDRLIDNQHPLAPEEIVLAKQAALVAQQIARESSLLPPLVEAHWFECFERYYRAQLANYTRFEDVSADVALEADEQIVADRAALGQLGAVAAAHAAGRADLQPALSRAFDDLAVGLQWEDDLMDWSHDLTTNQRNLLLAGLDSDSSGNGGVNERLRTVEEGIIQKGTYTLAVERAGARMAAAEEQQRALGCDGLAAAIAGRRRGIEDLARRLKRQIAREGGVLSANVDGR